MLQKIKWTNQPKTKKRQCRNRREKRGGVGKRPSEQNPPIYKKRSSFINFFNGYRDNMRFHI